MAFTSITTLSGVTTIKVTSVNDVSGITLERSGNGYIVKYADTILNKPSTDSTIAGSTTKVKVVVGVGNIYASEALFMAGIRPTTKASRLTKPRVARLHAAIIQVLNRAVEQGGSSLKDFVSAEGRTGYFQLEAAVYGRAGEPCRVCTTSIKSMLQGQRTTFYCPICQKP